MNADTRTRRFSERTVRRIRIDSNLAMTRARFCPDYSEVIQLRCVDDCCETDRAYGSQLWYFEGIGVDQQDQRRPVFGVIEYSIQFGLHELLKEGVFDAEQHRERFRQLYERETHRPAWRKPPRRWLATGLVVVGLACFVYLLVQTLAA